MHIRIFWSCLLLAGIAAAQPPVPSRWEGRITGAIRGRPFDLPITVELKKPLPNEMNPFNLYVGTGEVNRVGDLFLSSANQISTGGAVKYHDYGHVGVYDYTVGHTIGSYVTLQYFTVKQEMNQVTAALTETQAQAAAAINMFTGPNVSAMEASDLMRGVHEALGPTEMFSIARGATIRLQFGPNTVTGSVMATGRSVLNTSSDVQFGGSIQAKRAQ